MKRVHAGTARASMEIVAVFLLSCYMVLALYAAWKNGKNARVNTQRAVDLQNLPSSRGAGAEYPGLQSSAAPVSREEQTTSAESEPFPRYDEVEATVERERTMMGEEGNACQKPFEIRTTKEVK